MNLSKRSALLVTISYLTIAMAVGQALVAQTTNDFTISFPQPTAEESQWYKPMPPEYQDRFKKAFEETKAVWASDQFRQRILAAQFEHYGSNVDHNSTIVFKTITSAHPKRFIYYLCSDTANAYATTDQIEGKTCVYESFMQGEGKTANALVNTLSHEFTHTADGGKYQHPVYSTRLSRFVGIGRNREMTVPYAVGNIAEDIATQMYPKSNKKTLYPFVLDTVVDGRSATKSR